MNSNLFEQHNNILLDILFNEDKKQIDSFNNNEKILLPDTFDNILKYPNILKEYKLCKKKKLFNTLLKILDGKIIDKKHNAKYRTIHPALLLIFYKEFIAKGYIFEEKYDNNIKNIYEIEHKNEYKKIKEQISNSFKIYFHLISDEELDEIFDINKEIKNNLYLNVQVEKYIYPTNIYRGKYIDMTYIFSKNNTISIEINEYGHNEVIDKIRQNQIYAKSLNKIIQYYTERTFESIIYDLYKEISRCIYKIDKQIGLNIFLVKCKKFNIEYSLKFTKIQKKIDSNKLTINCIMEILEDYKIKKFEKLLFKMIKNNDLHTDFFVNVNNLDEITESSYKEKLLNSKGVTRIFNYFRTKDFESKKIAQEFISEITTSYARFMDSYYEMINENLNDSNNDILTIHEQYKSDIIKKNTSIFISYIDYDNIIELIKKSDLSYHPYLPILIEDSDETILKIDIEQILDRCNIEKNIYKNFIKKIEKQEIIKNYRLINESEIQKITKKCRLINKSEIEKYITTDLIKDKECDQKDSDEESL